MTEADRAVERLLRERLASLFPGDGFLGEEDGRSDGGAGGLLWVVDPIDGTSNYARGRARWCVSIGLMEGEAPLLGVLAAPLAGDIYRACRGDGAFLNDRPMVPTACTDPASAMIELSWSPRVAHPVWTAAVGRLLEAGAMPRTEGSARSVWPISPPDGSTASSSSVSTCGTWPAPSRCWPRPACRSGMRRCRAR